MAMIDQEEFLLKYKITTADLATVEIDWDVLNQIYEDYLSRVNDFDTHAAYITKFISGQLNSLIHSAKYRIKDPEHLIAKIIRKKIGNPEREINLKNYMDEITDLIGVRLLHLFKDEWEAIHEYITGSWELTEQFTANIREGDKADLFVEKGGLVKVHPAGYRCVHYLLNHQAQKQTFIVEIQVRTIFEEAWSEIDHKVRYPNHNNDEMLSDFLDVFNRLAGSADEMGTFLNLLVRKFDELEQNHGQELAQREDTIMDLQDQIHILTGQVANLKISAKAKMNIAATISEIDKRAQSVKTASEFSSKRRATDKTPSLGLSEIVLLKVQNEELLAAQTAMKTAFQDNTKKQTDALKAAQTAMRTVTQDAKDTLKTLSEIAEQTPPKKVL